jgi:hypothetical protein
MNCNPGGSGRVLTATLLTAPPGAVAGSAGAAGAVQLRRPRCQHSKLVE